MDDKKIGFSQKKRSNDYIYCVMSLMHCRKFCPRTTGGFFRYKGKIIIKQLALALTNKRYESVLTHGKQGLFAWVRSFISKTIACQCRAVISVPNTTLTEHFHLLMFVQAFPLFTQLQLHESAVARLCYVIHCFYRVFSPN